MATAKEQDDITNKFTMTVFPDLEPRVLGKFASYWSSRPAPSLGLRAILVTHLCFLKISKEEHLQNWGSTVRYINNYYTDTDLGEWK